MNATTNNADIAKLKELSLFTTNHITKLLQLNSSLTPNSFSHSSRVDLPSAAACEQTAMLAEMNLMNLPALLNLANTTSWQEPSRFGGGILAHSGEAPINCNDSINDDAQNGRTKKVFESAFALARIHGVYAQALNVAPVRNSKHARPNHYVTLVIEAKEIDGEQHVQCHYFNSIAGYSWVPETAERLINDLEPHATFHNHQKQSQVLQKNTYDCGSFCALFIYLSQLKTVAFNASVKPHSLFSQLVGATKAAQIADDIKSNTLSPLDAMVSLIENNAEIVQHLRLLEFKEYLEDVSTDTLKKEMLQLLDKIHTKLQDLDLTSAENLNRAILLASLISLGTGVVAHIILATAIGSGGALYSTYEILNEVNQEQTQKLIADVQNALVNTPAFTLAP